MTSASTLSHLSFSVKAGETIAFVGPSGSGKSTILKLLAGLYHPTQWDITINNTPISEVDLTAFKQQIGMVTQDPQLFSGTVKQNLLFVKPDATDEDIWLVLKQAALDEFIQTLAQGIDTFIGEWGIKLSWGQKQRLAIARALLRQPQLLIFDEATSALDSLVEREIADTIVEITKLHPDMITILVAHRLSTVMKATRIYVLEKWHICEHGTHQELLDQKWLYYALRREQIGSEDEHIA